MSRIDQQEIQQAKWNQIPATNSREHPDYQKNLKSAEAFCQGVKKHLLNGMNVKISDSEHLQKALLIISWKPGLADPKGNYATPVFLHQGNEDFKKETQSVMSFYMKNAKTHEPKDPLPDNFFGATAIKA